MRGRRALRLFLVRARRAGRAAAARIERAFGPEAIDELRADPYAATEVDGVGFATADALARALGTAAGRAGAARRRACSTRCALAERDGHCLLPRDELERRAERAARRADRRARSTSWSRSGGSSPTASCVAEPAMDRRRAARSRGTSASSRRRPRAAPAPRSSGPPAASSSPPTASGRSSTRCSAGAWRSSRAVRAPARRRRCARSSTSCARNARTVRLCAPTGKAARRLTEATGAPATTIHRLLEWIPGEGFARGPDDPIDGHRRARRRRGVDALLTLADALLGAVGPRTHVLLVGDVDQLAAGRRRARARGPDRVGRRADGAPARGLPPGRALADRPRGARDQRGRAAAARSRSRRHPRLLPRRARRGAGDVRRGRRRSPRGACPATTGSTRADVLVLAPMHRGPLGVDALNDALRARLNPDGERDPRNAAARRRPRDPDAQRPRARADERRARNARPPRLRRATR